MSWRVGAVMTQDVVSVQPDTSFKDCVEMVVAAFVDRVEGVVGVDDELTHLWDDTHTRAAAAIG
jgi:CBS domain-containing protein